MIRYATRIAMQIVPMMLIIITGVFVLVRVSGDPVALMLPENATDLDRQRLTEALGLDQPLWQQYLRFISDLAQGQFGTSFRYNQEALPIVLERLPASLELAGMAVLIAILISLPLGILSALNRNSAWDLLITGASVLGKAAPNFWVGIMLILLFAVQLHWLPVSGRGTFWHVLLPAFTLGFGLAAQLTRLIRANLLDVLGQDYVRTARAKGLSESVVVTRHALKNSLLPAITVLAMDMSGLIGGALITETIFAWPGVGQLVIQAVSTKDMAIVQAAVVVIAFLVILCNVLADIVYRLVDPRIKY